MPKLVRGSIPKNIMPHTIFKLTNNTSMQLEKYSKKFKEDNANTTKAKFSNKRPDIVKLVSKPVYLTGGPVYLTYRPVLFW